MPLEFLQDLFRLYMDRSDDFMRYINRHIYLTRMAVMYITIVSLTVGTLMTYSKKLANVVLGATNFLFTIPSVALFGFLIPFTGLGVRSAIIAMSVYGALPMIRNTYVGLKEVSRDVIESAIGMGSREWQLLLFIKFPLALPVIIAGFRTMVIMVIAFGGIASLIGAGGLGQPIWRGINTNNHTLMVAGALAAAMLAVVIDLVLNLVERGVRKLVYGKAEGSV